MGVQNMFNYPDKKYALFVFFSGVAAGLALGAAIMTVFLLAAQKEGKMDLQKRKKELEELKTQKKTLVLFESPHRIMSTLEDIAIIMGDRTMVLARELTKAHEEIKKGTITGIIEYLNEGEKRGEFTILIQGRT